MKDTIPVAFQSSCYKWAHRVRQRRKLRAEFPGQLLLGFVFVARRPEDQPGKNTLVSLSLLLLLLSLFLLFSQEPLGAWKYSNPSFLYCLAPLHRLASSCLEGWRCGHECCSSRCSSQISSSHFLLLIWLSLALSPYDFLSLSFPPSSVTSLWFSPLDIPLSFSWSSLYSLFSSAVLHIRS